MNGWNLLTTPPPKSGRYIVGHRGTSKVIHFLNPSDSDTWHPYARLGWQEDPRSFGATHYCELPEITNDDSAEATADLKRRHLTRVVKPLTRTVRIDEPVQGWLLLSKFFNRFKPTRVVERTVPIATAKTDSRMSANIRMIDQV